MYLIMYLYKSYSHFFDVFEQPSAFVSYYYRSHYDARHDSGKLTLGLAHNRRRPTDGAARRGLAQLFKQSKVVIRLNKSNHGPSEIAAVASLCTRISKLMYVNVHNLYYIICMHVL